MNKARAVGALLGLLVLLLVTPSAAREPDPRARAQELFRQANQLFSRGLFLDALKRYRQARALYPSFKIDLNIGQTLQRMKRDAEAAVYYEKFLLSAAKAPPAITAKVKKQLALLRQRLASVKVSCMEDGVMIKLDGRAVGKTPMDLPLYVKPGKHQLSAARHGMTPFSRDLVLEAGQHLSLDVPTVPPASAEVVKPPGDDAGEKDRQARRRKTIWAYSTLGVGAALAVTAAVLYGVGGSQGSEAHDLYREATDHQAIADYRADLEGAESKLIAANVIMGAAAVAIGLSVYHFVTRPSEAPAAPGTPRASITLTGDQGALLTIGGSF